MNLLAQLLDSMRPAASLPQDMCGEPRFSISLGTRTRPPLRQPPLPQGLGVSITVNLRDEHGNTVQMARRVRSGVARPDELSAMTPEELLGFDLPPHNVDCQVLVGGHVARAALERLDYSYSQERAIKFVVRVYGVQFAHGSRLGAGYFEAGYFYNVTGEPMMGHSYQRRSSNDRYPYVPPEQALQLVPTHSVIHTVA